MHITARQEQFSKAMVRAVAAVAGFNIATTEVDDDSVDIGLVGKRRSNTVISTPELDLQLKCTTTDDGQGSTLPYDLEIKNYDDLRDPNVHAPRILVVCCVPRDLTDWLHETTEATAMRRCAYWLSLRGLSPTENDDSFRVHLPRTQLFTVTSLTAIMERISMGGLP